MPLPKSPSASFYTGSPEEEALVADITNQYAALRDALTSRQQLFDPTLLAMAQGFLAPTRAGSTGESFAAAAGLASQAEQAQQKQALENAMMRAQLAQSELGSRQTARQQQLASKIYTQSPTGQLQIDPQAALAYAQQTGDPKAYEQARAQQLQQLAGQIYKKSESGDLVFDPDAALQVVQLTGDPKLAEQVISHKRDAELKSAYNKLFTENPEGKVTFNPTAISSIFKLGGFKEVSEALKSIPEMRRLGLLGETGAEGTPFDALALMVEDPLIKKQAQDYAERYKKGLINDEQADKLAKDILQMYTSHMDRASALAQSKAIAAVAQGFAAQRAADAQRKAEEDLRLKAEQRLQKQQEYKTGYETAERTIAQVEHIKNHPGKATGFVAAFRPNQFIPGTDAYSFHEQLNTLRSQSFLASVQQMRGLGALSNAEGQKIQDAIASINPKMKEPEFDRSLSEIIKIMNQAKQRSRDLLEGRPVKLPEDTTAVPQPRSGFKVIGTEPAGG